MDFEGSELALSFSGSIFRVQIPFSFGKNWASVPVFSSAAKFFLSLQQRIRPEPWKLAVYPRARDRRQPGPVSPCVTGCHPRSPGTAAFPPILTGALPYFPLKERDLTSKVWLPCLGCGLIVASDSVRDSGKMGIKKPSPTFSLSKCFRQAPDTSSH